MNESAAASRRFGCPSCGGGLRYDIAAGKMKCDQCGNLTGVDALPSEEDAVEIEVTEFHCPQCGAVLYSMDTEITSFCSFCGSDVVLTGKIASTKRPAGIIPFRVTREQCEKIYRDHMNKFPLAPSKLKSKKTVTHFRPIYIPFWSYSFDAQGPVKLQGKKTYTQKKGRRDYLYEETYNLSRTVRIHKENTLYDASTAFEDDIAARLKNTHENVVPFHPAYLSGFYAHGADVNPNTYEPEVSAQAARILTERVLSQEPVDSVELQGYLHKDFALPNAQYHEELVMIPAWLLVCRHGRRVVSAAVNGVNGELVSDVPISGGKATAAALTLGAGLFALLRMVMTWAPNWMMLFWALLMLFIQLRFSKMQLLISALKARINEPDFDKTGGRFAGPAQSKALGSRSGIIAGKTSNFDTFEWRRGLAGLILFLIIVSVEPVIRWLHATPSPEVIQTLVRLSVLPVLIAMAVSIYRTSRDGKPGMSLPGSAACAAIFLGLLNTLSSSGSAVLFYACPLVILAAAVAEIILLCRMYNQYTSRPVPFYGSSE